MKKRIISVFVLMLTVLLCLSGCTKKEGEKTGYDLSGKTYYNTVDTYGNEEHSKVWFGKDGSFVLKDNYSGGFIESSGTWSVSENVVTLEITDTGKKIIFEIVDEDTLKLKTTLTGSEQDQIFSTTETKGSSGSSGSSSDGGFTYTSYYNISQSSTKVSRVEIRSDGSFGFFDQNDLSITEINGTYTKENDVLKMKGDEFSKGKEFEFKVKSDGTLVLQNDIGISATGDIFSKDYKASERIPCTGLTSLYNNYWATEGVKNYDLEVKTTPANTTDVITYTVEDENVVTVSADGKASTVSPGKTKIHIKCGDVERVVGFETRAKGPSSISFDENPVYLYMSNTAKIKAKALPETADQTLTYTSSDESIVTVDKDGNLFGVSPGNAEITVKAVNGTSAVCKVCVEGETVVFEIDTNISVKAASGTLIPFKAYLVSCYDGDVNKQDVTEYVDFHTAYTSALTLKSPGYLCASGAIFQTFDCPFYFEFSDGSSLHVTSETFYIHIVK